MDRKEFRDTYKYFRADEVLSPDGLTLLDRTGICPIPDSFMRLMVEFREFVGKSLIVNHETSSGKKFQYRGFRSHDENRLVYKTLGLPVKEFSSHVYGGAMDITALGMTTEELYRKVKEFGKFSGIGRYGTFIHVDNRNTGDRVTEWKV